MTPLRNRYVPADNGKWEVKKTIPRRQAPPDTTGEPVERKGKKKKKKGKSKTEDAGAETAPVSADAAQEAIMALSRSEAQQVPAEAASTPVPATDAEVKAKTAPQRPMDSDVLRISTATVRAFVPRRGPLVIRVHVPVSGRICRARVRMRDGCLYTPVNNCWFTERGSVLVCLGLARQHSFCEVGYYSPLI